MSFADMALGIKFLKLYVPELKVTKYKQNGKLRFLEASNSTDNNSSNEKND